MNVYYFRWLKVKRQYHTPKIWLIVQSFSDLLFDTLEYHYSRMKDMLAIQQEQKYKRHRPETTLLYQLVERYYPEFTASLAEQDKYLPKLVEPEFDEYLRCGRLEHGFMRVVCGDCKHEKLVAFSCKRRGFCPSCGARRMVESAALLVDDVLSGYPIHQWVLSLPIPLRLLLARYSTELSKVMQLVHRAISTHIVSQAGFTNKLSNTSGFSLHAGTKCEVVRQCR
jgi:ribosomal protein S27E